jgi:hypothetical protein
MAEPIILDGGAQKITITLPSSARQPTPGVFVFVVEPDKADLFKTIVVKNAAGAEAFSQNDLSANWVITIS